MEKGIAHTGEHASRQRRKENEEKRRRHKNTAENGKGHLLLPQIRPDPQRKLKGEGAEIIEQRVKEPIGNGETRCNQKDAGEIHREMDGGDGAQCRKAVRKLFHHNSPRRGRPADGSQKGTRHQTLKRNRVISPSAMTYSLPSRRTRPFSLAAAMLPQASKSL